MLLARSQLNGCFNGCSRAGTLAMLTEEAKVGVKVVDLCIKGDEFLMA
jgi:hypothetical protein